MSSLPEFEAIGEQAITTPIRRTRHVLLVGITRSNSGEPLIESRTIGYRRALRRRPCAKARHSGPQRKIRIGLGARHTLGCAFHTHLAFELDPEEHQRGARIGSQIAPFAAVVVRVETKTPRVELFQQ